MSEKEKKEMDFSEGYVITPLQLYNSGVSGEAQALFAVMRSFGPRAEASVKAYAFRLGWHTDRVKKYQKELLKKGWMVLYKEGTADEPRLWWTCHYKGEVPPPELVAGDGKTHTPILGGGDLRGPCFTGAQNTPPKQHKKISSIRDQEVIEENIFSDSKSSKFSQYKTNPDFLKFQEGVKALWLKRYPAGPAKSWPTSKPFNTLAQNAVRDFGAEVLLAWWENMVFDPWLSAASLGKFVAEPDAWKTRRVKFEKTQSRAFNSPDCDWKPDASK